MKLLVTGREGQLARSLLERASAYPDIDVTALGRPDLDLERPESARRAIRELRPDMVVNAAAYTAVDQAEQEPYRAFRINAHGAGEVAAAASEVGAAIIHLSTDYVFDGSARVPWQPGDATGPLNIYGASKLAGEEQVSAANPKHLIIRTSWVFSPFGRNFMRTMLRLGAEREEVRVVSDQQGCPTNALDLADAILTVASRWSEGSQAGVGATMHVAGAERCSWAEFAEAVFEASGQIAGPVARVVPVPSSEFPTPARRPTWSVLDCTAFEQAFDFPMRSWRKGLSETVSRILRDVG